jgi:hypothetical protein
MPLTCFHRTAAIHHRHAQSQHSFVHPLSVRRQPDADWYDDEPDPFSDDPWDPDALDDDEPEPEPGDFWPEIDDD